jgi:hypothetical protein
LRCRPQRHRDDHLYDQHWRVAHFGVHRANVACSSRCDAFTAAEVDGIWQVYSTEAREPLGSTRHSTLPVALEALGDQLVLLSQPLSNEYPKEVRVATTPPLK